MGEVIVRYGIARSFVALACPTPPAECTLPGPVIELTERQGEGEVSVKVLTRAEAEQLRAALGCALRALEAGAHWDAANAEVSSKRFQSDQVVRVLCIPLDDGRVK